jgi:hypothetical protein
MFPEMKRTAMLLCEGLTSDEIVSLSMDKNIYQLDKPKRRRDVPLRMIKRLSTIKQPLVDIIVGGSEHDARLIAFLALMKADRLLFEYMIEVYADKRHAGYDEITDKDFLDFIERKAQNSETVAKWSEGSLASVRGKIKSSMCEAGLAKIAPFQEGGGAKRRGLGGCMLILKPIVDDRLRKLLDEADKIYLKAMLMEG